VRRNRAWLLAVVSLALTALQAPAVTAAQPREAPVTAPAGSIGIQLLEAPVSLKDNPRAHQYVIDYLPPGMVIHRKVKIDNTSDQRQHVDLYPAAATITGGAFDFAPNRTANELTRWIGVDPPSSDLPPGGSATVEATIAVPRSASDGERYAVIWAQDSSPPRQDGGVRMINRVGVRVYLDIGLGGEPVSDFQINDLIGARTADGRPEVLADVQNTGARALDMSGALTLTDGPGALSAGPFPADLGVTLGIKQSGRVTVPLDKRLPAGPWTAHLTLISGVTQHSVTATITFPSGTGANQPVKPDHSRAWYILVLEIAGPALLLLLVGLLIYLWLRRRKARATGNADVS
jgi:hypothetical protein